jgi:hypothetical protein
MAALKFHWISVFLVWLPYVFYALILNFIALLMGNRILRWLKVESDSKIEKIIFSLPLGWGIYSIGVFCLGISGLLYKEAVYCFLVLLGVLSILEIERFFREWKVLSSTSRFKLDRIDLVFLPVIIIFLALQFVISFSPLTSGDPVIYHMALPKLYIRHHALTHAPGFFYSTLPAHTEMLYLLGLITSGETLSKLFSFSISSMFLVSIFFIGNKCFSKGTGYLATIIMMLSGPVFYFTFSEPYVDTALGLSALLGIYSFFIWIEARKVGYLYLSAICCALAASTKIHGLFFVLLFFVGFLATVKMDKLFTKKLAWCILAVSIIALPWYIRSWWLTGDPVFPFLYDYLGASASGGWNKYSNECFTAHHSHPIMKGAKGFSDFIRLTKNLFFSATLPKDLWTSGNLKIFTLIFLIPAFITLRNWNRVTRYLFFVALAYYFFVIFTSPQIRFFFVGFAILALIVAHFIKTVWTKYKLTRIPIVLCIVSIFMSFFGIYGIAESQFFAGLGVLDKKQFLDETPRYGVFKWVNGILPQDSKILTWRMEGYHLEREYVRVNPAFQGVLDFGIINDAPTFLKSIKKLEITHLLYDHGISFRPYGRLKVFLNKCLTELREDGRVAVIKRIGSCIIYSVVPEQSPGSDETLYRKHLCLPKLLGSYDTPSSALDVCVSGNMAYVADYISGLQIIDISNPAAPIWRSSYDTPGRAEGVYVSGSTAYVADWDGGLQIIDISNPDAPMLLGSYDTPGGTLDDYIAGSKNPPLPTQPPWCGALDVYVSDNTAYVADGYGGIQIIDVSNPAAPTFLGSYDTPGEALSVYVSGNTAYVADFDSGLQIIDVSNPAAPTFLGSCDTPGYAWAVNVSGTTAYVADQFRGLQIIDVSNPTAPALLGSYDTIGKSFGIFISGSTAYMADGYGDFQIIDVSNPTMPVLLGIYDTPGMTLGVYVSGTTAYVADWDKGLQLIDVSNCVSQHTVNNSMGDTSGHVTKK